MTTSTRVDFTEIQRRVCDIAVRHLGIDPEKAKPTSRLIEDLGIDSLDAVEFVMELEDEFQVTIPEDGACPVGKSIFARQPFRLSDMAEVVYVNLGTGKPQRSSWFRRLSPQTAPATLPFTQLGGRLLIKPIPDPLFEALESNPAYPQFRRRTDGMRCVRLPGGTATIGGEEPESQLDERPVHTVELDSFLIDAETVSTTAYCRFLNSVSASEENLLDWFILDSKDDRIAQQQIALVDNLWRPIAGTEMMPIVLVSWYGANAYALWANRQNWHEYETDDRFLPTEAQWEYAAQGANSASDTDDLGDPQFVFGQHAPGTAYLANTMPMAPVHAPLGLSRFGLLHMAGNVWQWCRDWYAEDFYQCAAANADNPVNFEETGIRSERGGSWVGPRELCRPSYRRGRCPSARGRCLGFRCISPVEFLSA